MGREIQSKIRTWVCISHCKWLIVDMHGAPNPLPYFLIWIYSTRWTVYQWGNCQEAEELGVCSIKDGFAMVLTGLRGTSKEWESALRPTKGTNISPMQREEAVTRTKETNSYRSWWLNS
jgi:hypothetical protein